MNILETISFLLSKEKSKEKRDILCFLQEHIAFVKPVSVAFEPLLYIKNDDYFLLFRDKWDNLFYVFKDFKDILDFLKKIVSSQGFVYFNYQVDPFELTFEEIWGKINESLEQDDKKMFLYYTNLLRKKTN